MKGRKSIQLGSDLTGWNAVHFWVMCIMGRENRWPFLCFFLTGFVDFGFYYSTFYCFCFLFHFSYHLCSSIFFFFLFFFSFNYY